MSNKWFFLFFFFLFPILITQLCADDLDQLPFNEDVIARRFRVRNLEGRALTHPGQSDLEQGALRGKTFLNYDVSAGQYACLFHAVQQPRQSLISALIEAAQKEDEQGIKIRTILRAPTLESLRRAADAFNPLIQVAKHQVCHFLRPFSQNGVFTPYEVALAYGVLHRKKVFVWQHQANKEIALLGCNADNYPEHLHIGYYPRHFQRLVLESAPDLDFNKAKSLLIEKRVGTPLSSFLTDNELARLRAKYMPKPNPQAPTPLKTVLPVPSALQRTTLPIFQEKRMNAIPTIVARSSFRKIPLQSSVQQNKPFATRAGFMKRTLPAKGTLPTKSGIFSPSLLQTRSISVPQKKTMTAISTGRSLLMKTPLQSSVQRNKPFATRAGFMKRTLPAKGTLLARNSLFTKRTLPAKGTLLTKNSLFTKRTLPTRNAGILKRAVFAKKSR